MPEYAELCHGALGLRLRGLLKRLSTVSIPLDFSHGSISLVSIDLAVGEIAMLDWKANLDTLVEETMTFAKSLRAEPTIPRTIVEPNRMWAASEREEIGYRIANFKAHQQRFKREREDYAASELKRMLAPRH